MRLRTMVLTFLSTVQTGKFEHTQVSPIAQWREITKFE